jgi:hypothetical protein
VEAEHLKLQKLADICREHINPQRNMQQQQQQHDSFSSALPQVPPGFHPPGLSPVHFNISPINEASVQMQHQSISPSAGSPGPPPGFETVHLPQQSTLQPPVSFSPTFVMILAANSLYFRNRNTRKHSQNYRRSLCPWKKSSG